MIIRDPEALLKELGIADPRAIDIETIAQYCGATVLYEPLEGSEARLIGYRDRAIITVDKSARRERQRFSAAHELGHWLWHRGKIAFVCDSHELVHQWNGGNQEAVANQYAASLLLPTYLFEPVAAGKPITFGTVKTLASMFQTSLTATAIRLVELSETPSIVICTGSTGRIWFIASEAMKASQRWPRRTLQTETMAYRLFHREEEPAGPTILSASAWFGGHDARQASVTEDSILITSQLVLTLLSWNVAPRR